MSHDSSSRTTQIMRIAVIAWLVVLTVAVAVLGFSFARLQQPSQDSAIETAMDALQARLATLETFKSETERKPVGLPIN